MNIEYVICHPEWGVYLGACLGLGFWSKLDPVGQECACTFPTLGDARLHVSSWQEIPEFPQHEIANLSFVPLKVTESGWASIDDCVAAQLPGWDPETEEKQHFAA